MTEVTRIYLLFLVKESVEVDIQISNEDIGTQKKVQTTVFKKSFSYAKGPFEVVKVQNLFEKRALITRLRCVSTYRLEFIIKK